MRIAICDDDEQYRMQLLMLTKKYASAHTEQQVSYVTFSSAEDLLETACSQSLFDVCILDIVMPGVNGIELGMRLRQNGYDGIIIYLTSSKEFAIDSYSTKAFDYLLKPVIPKKLFSVLENAYATISDRAKKSIIVKTKNSSVRLTFDSILYAQLCKRVVVYHLTNGETVESILLRIPFAEAMQELLTDTRFTFCGQSTVVNLCHITLVGNEEIIFKGTHKVYFNKKLCREIRSTWSDFWFDKDI